MTSKALLFISSLLLSSFIGVSAQVALGPTLQNDLYLHATNPDDDRGGSAGSALLNLGVGPKIWVGHPDLSLSVEALAVFSPFALDVGNYKGLGMASFPIIAKINTGGMTGLDKEGEFGMHFGAGIQYTRTELYGITRGFRDDGGERSLFPVYIVQVGGGFGMSGFAGSLYGRFGWDGESGANMFSIGLQCDLNPRMINKISSPESSL